MNINEQDWQDEEFWDSEHGEDEDFNDIGCDVDANNDETFDNAAEWNEDEHEELIARDSILSHSINPQQESRNQQQQQQNQQYNNNNNNHHHQTSHRNEQHKTSSRFSSTSHQASLENSTRAFPLESTRQVLRVDELEQQLMRTRISNQQIQHQTPPLRQSLPQLQPETSRPPIELSRRSGWSPFGGKDLFTSSAVGSNHHKLSEYPHSDQLPQNISLELQRQIFQEQQRQHQMAIMQQQHRQQQHQQQQERLLMSHQNLQCFTVEEIERQMLANSRPKPQPSPQLKNEPEETKVHINLVMAPQIKDEAESNRRETAQSYKDNRDRFSERSERFHNGGRYGGSGGDSRDDAGRGNHHREEREYNRENNNRRQDNYDRRKFNDNRRRFTIIPPQVQLSVIEKVVQQYPNSAVKPGEFLQDKISPHKYGLLYKRLPAVLNDRMNHDGILTEKERSWLTKIQEKIQADYDDKLDQDYYYLLYFNRTSKTNDSSKSCGSGVPDRRFIPRERLLYNSST